MKRVLTFVLLFIIALVCITPLISIAQKKPAATKKRRVTPMPTPMPTPDLRAEAAQVAEQIKNVSRFVYVYGKVVNGLEIAEDQSRRGQMTAAAAAQNRRSQEALINQIYGLRTALESLVQKFQFNSRVQIPYLKLKYAAEAASDAEQFAASAQYDEAGRALTTVVERLTDALVSFR